ncbi:MAG: hypothetical protein Q7N50_03365, partial [Armatimonadota bacterium]|nr:hypothetical protein [Armatimonadota bacterium]
CRDGILRALGLWPTTAGSVKITYVAGYTSEELRGSDSILNASPIWAATLDEVVRKAKRTLMLKKGTLGWTAGVMASESLGDYSYSANQKAIDHLFTGDIAGENREQLGPFVNYGWDLGS